MLLVPDISNRDSNDVLPCFYALTMVSVAAKISLSWPPFPTYNGSESRVTRLHMCEGFRTYVTHK